MEGSHLHIAIPAMDELEFLPLTLSCIAEQKTNFPFTVYVCVNQPDAWWNDTEKLAICERNQQLIKYLHQAFPFQIEILDYSSKGSGWSDKNSGVGWARKKLFEHIFQHSNLDDDIIISIDADTTFSKNYFESVGTNLQKHPQWHAISVPYYHKLTGQDELDKMMLRYEIFMRNYALNLLHIKSPYSFTALGSAIAVRVKSLMKIGGITPLKSGEDFYLLQKLRKMGEVGLWNAECVYPGNRFSDRVLFGTGPAMQKGATGNWESYPIYPYSLFQKIADTYQQLDELYLHDIDTPFLNFLEQQFRQKDLWQPIRNNVKNATQFQRAFHEKADGLRILQFLKQENKGENIPEMKILHENITKTTSRQYTINTRQEILSLLSSCPQNNLTELDTPILNQIRDAMFDIEMFYRKLYC